MYLEGREQRLQRISHVKILPAVQIAHSVQHLILEEKRSKGRLAGIDNVNCRDNTTYTRYEISMKKRLLY